MQEDQSSPDESGSFPRRIWTQWRRAAHAIGVVQARFFMLMIYAFVVIPTGIFMKTSSDPLHLAAPKETNCVESRQAERDLESARRQF